jgi:hypothetical protein
MPAFGIIVPLKQLFFSSILFYIFIQLLFIEYYKVIT